VIRLAWIAAVAACHSAAPAAEPQPRDAVGLLYVTSNVGDALVYIDGNIVGAVSSVAKGLAVDPGRHRVELRHDDYFSRYAELALRSSQVARLTLDMVPILP